METDKEKVDRLRVELHNLTTLVGGARRTLCEVIEDLKVAGKGLSRGRDDVVGERLALSVEMLNKLLVRLAD